MRPQFSWLHEDTPGLCMMHMHGLLVLCFAMLLVIRVETKNQAGQHWPEGPLLPLLQREPGLKKLIRMVEAAFWTKLEHPCTYKGEQLWQGHEYRWVVMLSVFVVFTP